MIERLALAIFVIFTLFNAMISGGHPVWYQDAKGGALFALIFYVPVRLIAWGAAGR